MLSFIWISRLYNLETDFQQPMIVEAKQDQAGPESETWKW